MFEKYDRHAELSGKMAGKLGVDLTEKYLEGKISAQALRGTVVQCMRCKNPDGCEKMLAGLGDAELMKAPEYCENRVMLEALRKS